VLLVSLFFRLSATQATPKIAPAAVNILAALRALPKLGENFR
jgi:hypothetical protein